MSLIRDSQWILTKYIRKMRFPRDLIFIRFTKLTLSNISYSFQRRNKIIHVINFWVDVSPNWQIRAKTKWLMFESVNLVKRVHIRSRGSRIFWMYFVKFSLTVRYFVTLSSSIWSFPSIQPWFYFSLTKYYLPHTQCVTLRPNFKKIFVGKIYIKNNCISPSYTPWWSLYRLIWSKKIITFELTISLRDSNKVA